MKSNIFIPKKIKVGFQNRSDTYTKKLAYVIYYDNKNKLRKETSWNGWRDKNIEPLDLDNEPISGFVLNKKAGDYSTGWNHRQAYTRVYDTRGFEFEITIENLLYILENANSIKGKGLEGEFIYGWDGKDLLLIPIDSPDYREISQYNNLIYKQDKIKSKDLKLGATYRTKQNKEWIYMGRFDLWEVEYTPKNINYGYNSYTRKNVIAKDINKGKYYYFLERYKWTDSEGVFIRTIKSLGDKFIDVVKEEPIEDYAELFEEIESSTEYSPYDESKDKYEKYTLDEFKERIKDRSCFVCYDDTNVEYEIGRVYYKYRTNDFYYREKHKDDWYYSDSKKIGTIEEIFEILSPSYKNEYLRNGKLYREGK